MKVFILTLALSCIILCSGLLAASGSHASVKAEAQIQARLMAKERLLPVVGTLLRLFLTRTDPSYDDQEYARKTQAPQPVIILKKAEINQPIPTWFNEPFTEKALQRISAMDEEDSQHRHIDRGIAKVMWNLRQELEAPYLSTLMDPERSGEFGSGNLLRTSLRGIKETLDDKLPIAAQYITGKAQIGTPFTDYIKSRQTVRYQPPFLTHYNRAYKTMHPNKQHFAYLSDKTPQLTPHEARRLVKLLGRVKEMRMIANRLCVCVCVCV
uniref:Uncharacterized protein n=1 Tax=Vitrella brassicaformis TaxID=1169539 RepID=A0A7S1K4I3_9ALVE